MKINGVEFNVEVDWDAREGRIDSMAVFLKDSDVELSDVLSDKVLDKIEEQYYLENPFGDQPEEDPREDR